jgi:hypothetical protein
MNSDHEKVAIIGHSMGTTQVFYGMIYNLEYFKNTTNIFIALAPPLDSGHVESPFTKLISMNFDIINTILLKLDIYEVFTPNMFATTAT